MINSSRRVIGNSILLPSKSVCRFAIVLLFILFPWQLMASDAASEPQLTVRGEAQLFVSPDQVTMVAGVLTEAKQSKEALSQNSRSMQTVIDALLALGIDKKDISTQNFRVQPVWSPRPRNADANWRSKIIAYRVSNDVLVKTTELDLIGDLITSASEAGANKIQSVNFGLADPRLYRNRALSKAVKNAREDADTAVTAAGLRIIGVKKIQIDQAVQSVEHVEKAMLMRSAVADAAPAVPIHSGDVTVRASVFMTYELDK